MSKKSFFLNIEHHKVDYKTLSNIKTLNDIYLGHAAHNAMKSENITADEEKHIKSNALQYYQIICDQIVSRFNFEDNKLSILKYLDPKVIKMQKDFSYFSLISEYPNFTLHPEKVIEEYKLLEIKAQDSSFKIYFEINDIEKFWFEVGNLKNQLEEFLFKNLYDFVIKILILPHSSACAERIFSKLTLIKNKLTNRLKVETCNSMLSALNVLDDKQLEDWVPDSILIKEYRNDVPKDNKY